jgi:hypothetical protein
MNIKESDLLIIDRVFQLYLENNIMTKKLEISTIC